MEYFTGRQKSNTIGPSTSHRSSGQGTTNGNAVSDGQDLIDQLLQEISDLRESTKQHKENLEVKIQEVDALKEIADINNKQMKKLFDDNDAKTKQVTSLEEELKKCKAESEKNEVFWRKALAGEQDLRRSYKEDLERLTESDPMKKAEIHALRERTMKLYEELNTIKKEKSTLQERIDRNIEIELELNCVESKLEASTRETAKLNEKLAAERTENEKLQERITNLYEQQQALKEEIRSLLTSSDGGIHRHWLIDVNEINMSDEILGTGAFGKVYAAEFRGTKMAAKSLHDIILSPYNREKFNREMSLSATARHPNIVQFIGAADIDNPILLYELMTTSLYSYLQKGQPLTRPQILDAGCDVAAALSYLHQHKPHPIIHRDVSSPNVLMDPLPRGKWRHKLSDLGAANLQCCVGKNSKLPGNPCYAAPEADNPDSHTPAMDVYSFGVLSMEITLCRALEGTREARNEQCNTIDWEPMKELVQMCTVGDYLKRPCISHVLRILQKF